MLRIIQKCGVFLNVQNVVKRVPYQNLLGTGRSSQAVPHRTLYAAEALGIDGFMQARERTKFQILNADAFRSKMEEFVNNENSKNMIFSEDLKNMIHIAEQTDVDLIKKMIHRFCSQSKETRFGNFVFGPPVMRLFYYLEDAESALQLFKSDGLDGFFDQLASYQIFFDLLYENQRYDDIIESFEIIKSRQVQGGRFPRHSLVLTFGACYKLNTPASLEYALKLFKEASTSGHDVMRKGITFLAALAIRQGQPHNALEILNNVKQQNYLTVRTLKALAFAHLKRFDDALFVLRGVLEIDRPTIEKQTFPSDMIEEMKTLFAENTNKEIQEQFEKLLGLFEKHGHISPDKLDEMLNSKIQHFVRTDDRGGYQQNEYRPRDSEYRPRDSEYRPRDSEYRPRDSEYRPRDNFNNRRRDRDYPSERTRRPGLHELY